ncbi:hypothetical protein MHU86_14997 [Fragilaria crotonensis]|nr:hypothetical protein MHU86_14997 [Fragilaria crotonensis]
MRETTFAERVHQAHPTEIYVPTIVAQNNLSLLKNMSTSSVWANAPASVRSPTPENPQNTYQAPTFGSKTGNSKPPGSLDRTGEDDGSKKKQAEKRKQDSRNNGILNPGSNPVLTSNVSTATTNSMTNTLGTHQACFHDLENEIQQRNESIKTQQKEFSKVNERLDVLKTQTMSTLHFCKESSQNVLELRQETSSQLQTLRQEAATNVLESRSNFAAMTALIQQLSMQLQAANQPPSHTGSCSSHQSDNEMSIKSTSTTRSTDSVQVMSPEKKKQRTPPSKPRTPPRNRHHHRTPSPSPKSGDRRKFRINQDIDVDTSYGNQVHNRDPQHIRIFFQNVKGLTYSSTGQDYDYYLSCRSTIDSDITGMAEANTAWQHPHLKMAFADRVKRQFHMSKIAYSAPSAEVDQVPETETFQAGGTVIFATGKMVPISYGNALQDPTGLGRWSGLTFRGKENTKLSVITAYRVCAGSIQSAPIGSSFAREYEHHRHLGKTSPRPRKLFLIDLEAAVKSLQADGHSIVLMMDSNGQLTDDADLQNFSSQCDHLHQPTSARPTDGLTTCSDAKDLRLHDLLRFSFAS